MIKLIHARSTENGNSGWDGKAKTGDQTGNEVSITDYYSKPWNVLLRYPNENIKNMVVTAAKKLANSNLVGYDQSARNTLYHALESYGFDVDKYISSGVKTETDCSAFIYAVFSCYIPSMRYTGNAPTTSTMREFFKQHGFNYITDSKYCNNTDNLLNGDILIKEGSHTVLVYNPVKPQTDPCLKKIAEDVIAGKYGNGAARKENLYNAIQKEVNNILK